MARPKLDDTLPPGVYPPSGTTGYPLGTGVLDDPYAPGEYPVSEDGVPCSNPIGCPAGVGITPSPVGPEPTMTWSFDVTHRDDAPHNVRWDFGDGTGTTLISTQDPEHTYADDGTYTVKANCHGQIGTCVVVAGPEDPPPAPMTLTAISPTSVASNSQVSFTVTGSEFAEGMVVRFWDGQGNFRGAYPATIVSDTEATVLLDTTSWTVGTGGVDVYLNAAWSDQLQFTITTDGGSNPAPGYYINLNPTGIDGTAPAFDVSVTASDPLDTFTSASVVYVDGAAVPTTFVNSGELKARIDPTSMGAGAQYPVYVDTGGSESEPVLFTVYG